MSERTDRDRLVEIAYKEMLRNGTYQGETIKHIAQRIADASIADGWMRCDNKCQYCGEYFATWKDLQSHLENWNHEVKGTGRER